MKLKDLPKNKKIELIERIISGDIPLIINDEIIENTSVLIKKDDKLYVNGIEVTWEQINAIKGESPIIVLPDNSR
jgi:hypothetical protein